MHQRKQRWFLLRQSPLSPLLHFLFLCLQGKYEQMYSKCTLSLERVGKYEQMYREVKSMDIGGKLGRTPTTLESQDGKTISDRSEVLGSWEGYVEELYESKNRPSSLEIEEQREVSEDDIGLEILRDEFELALREMKNGKATGIDNIPVELIKNVGEQGKKELFRICNEIYETGEWPNDFLETVMIPLPKKPNAKRCEDYRTISLISHSAKILLRILNRRLYGRTNEEIEEEQFGFRKGKGTRDAIGLLRVIGERFIEKGKEVYVVFVDLEKAFDTVNW